VLEIPAAITAAAPEGAAADDAVASESGSSDTESEESEAPESDPVLSPTIEVDSDDAASYHTPAPPTPYSVILTPASENSEIAISPAVSAPSGFAYADEEDNDQQEQSP